MVKISILLLSYVVPVKSKMEISQNFVAFSEYMNFYLEGQSFTNKNCLFYAKFFEFEVKS